MCRPRRLDLNPEAPTDPWTKGAHIGMSHMYLGQRGATKLAAKAGVKVPPNYVTWLKRAIFKWMDGWLVGWMDGWMDGGL